VSSSTAARRTSALPVSSGWSTSDQVATADSARVIAFAYGAEAATFARARAMRDVAISSMALKIFFSAWVDRMRLR
jgi:hypothetical protein